MDYHQGTKGELAHKQGEAAAAVAGAGSSWLQRDFVRREGDIHRPLVEGSPAVDKQEEAFLVGLAAVPCLADSPD